MFRVSYLGIWWRQDIWISENLKSNHLKNENSFWSEKKKIFFLVLQVLSFKHTKQTSKIVAEITFKELMKKAIALLMWEKQPGMNGKMMTPTFFKLYTVYIKKLGHFFLHTLLSIHCSVASYKYFEKIISEVWRFF